MEDGYGRVYNAFIKRYITLEEACLAVGSNLYLKEKVSAIEIDELLKHFKAGFYFYGKTNITLDEFMDMVKNGERKYDGNIKLSRLLEKGETE